MFALLISGIGTLVAIYAGGYLARHPQFGPLLPVSAALYDGYAGPGAVGQHHHDVYLLGSDQSQLLLADWLQPSSG